jgi:hypothetical protein
MPIGVTGPESPVSMTTSMALAVMPLTPGLRNFGSQGMWSSEPLRVGGNLLNLGRLLAVDVEDEGLHAPLMPRAS